jgi:hypothetical protein
MAFEDYLANRPLHMVLLILMIGVLIAPEFYDWAPELGAVAGLAPILGWSLGVTYERSLVIVEGLVDPDTLREAERRRSSIWED